MDNHKSKESVDLASGDHLHCSKCFKKISKSKSFSYFQGNGRVIRPKMVLSAQDMQLDNMKTMVKYKNEKFYDVESNTSPEHDDMNKAFENEINNLGYSVQRPVTCPVSTCSKILARGSILQHFYFDHSKVPRIKINDSEPYDIPLKASSFSENVRCYAVLLLNDSASLSHTTEALMNGGYKNSSLLLMGVRMPRASAETVKKLHGSESVCIRDVQTQTDGDARSSKFQSSVSNSLIKHTSQNDIPSNVGEFILLWISKLGELNHYYNISVRRPDKKLGFSFTGKAINIEETHNPQAIYEQLECLVIQGRAINRLINEQSQLEICINILE